MEFRNLHAKEALFLEKLLKGRVQWEKYILQLRTAKVINLNVKYCLKFLLEQYDYQEVENFGSNMVQKQIIDKDKVPVLIYLDLDRKGEYLSVRCLEIRFF